MALCQYEKISTCNSVAIASVAVPMDNADSTTCDARCICPECVRFHARENARSFVAVAHPTLWATALSSRFTATVGAPDSRFCAVQTAPKGIRRTGRNEMVSDRLRVCGSPVTLATAVCKRVRSARGSRWYVTCVQAVGECQIPVVGQSDDFCVECHLGGLEQRCGIAVVDRSDVVQACRCTHTASFCNIDLDARSSNESRLETIPSSVDEDARLIPIVSAALS